MPIRYDGYTRFSKRNVLMERFYHLVCSDSNTKIIIRGVKTQIISNFPQHTSFVCMQLSV